MIVKNTLVLTGAIGGMVLKKGEGTGEGLDNKLWWLRSVAGYGHFLIVNSEGYVSPYPADDADYYGVDYYSVYVSPVFRLAN